MTKKLIFGKNQKIKINSFKKSSNSVPNQKKFNYHQRLPFKFANFELKYIWNVIAFLGITVTLLLILQNLTAYSSNFTPKFQTVRLITNFNRQEKLESQNNVVVQEFGLESSIGLDKNLNLSSTATDNKNSKNETKESVKTRQSKSSSQKVRIKKNQKSAPKSESDSQDIAQNSINSSNNSNNSEKSSEISN